MLANPVFWVFLFDLHTLQKRGSLENDAQSKKGKVLTPGAMVGYGRIPAVSNLCGPNYRVLTGKIQPPAEAYVDRRV